MTHWTKIFISLTLISYQTISYANTSSDIDSYKKSWTAQALKLQRDIDKNVPLNLATIIGTHNSYNSKSYQIPLVSYVDPNQLISIHDQLEMDIRSIEFDAHWTATSASSKNILLCHGQDNHLGCSAFDREITEGLKELRDWLKVNPNEIVLLYIERHLDGHEPRMASLLDSYLGDFIFKPTQVRKNSDNPKGCVAIPSDSLTKADILKAGKQLLIVTKKCDGDNPNYAEQDKYPQNWNDFVFAGIGNIPSHKYTFLDSRINSFTPYPDCGKSTIFYPDMYHTSLWRIFEDRTKLSNATEPQKKILDDDMRELMRCEINWPTMDMLTIGDSRLTAAVWSWASNYPQKDQGQCTIYKTGEGIKNKACSQLATGVACIENESHSIKAIPVEGTWGQGESFCQTVAGANWHFTTPINGYQMNALKESALNNGLSEVWLNYAMDDAGNWKVN